MALALLIVFYYLAELLDPFVEWVEIVLVVNPGFVHVVQDLLHEVPAKLTIVLRY